jgi:hypothetical protein
MLFLILIEWTSLHALKAIQVLEIWSVVGPAQDLLKPGAEVGQPAVSAARHQWTCNIRE